MIEALIEPLLLYRIEWDCTRCAVCHGEKWQFYPFCRSCSIKLQCARMMDHFRDFRGRSSDELEEKAPRATVRMFEHYDRARDFLVAVQQGRAHPRRRRKDDEEG